VAKRQPIPFGKYFLLDRINIGGMAEVWRGKTFGEQGFEKLVAIKRILPNIAEDDEFITMFIDEAKITVQLTHANVAQVFDLGKIGDSYFIAMEYIAGRDMRAIFDRGRKKGEPAPIPMVCFMIGKMCEGLDYAHRKKDSAGQDLNIVHRDVSPQNCLISFEGEVKVIDFGIAKAANKATKTQAGILKGKFGYMSPEQVRGMPLDQRSDVFACGVVLYEMLTGERLFVGDSDFSVLEKVRQVDILPPTSYNKRIPEGLEQIVLKALAKDPEERYTYASDIADALQRFLLTSESVFSRKDLMQYMKSTFAEDVEREKLRQAEYAEIKLPPGMAALAGAAAGGARKTGAIPAAAVAATAAAAAPPPVRKTGAMPVVSASADGRKITGSIPAVALRAPPPVPSSPPPPPSPDDTSVGGGDAHASGGPGRAGHAGLSGLFDDATLPPAPRPVPQAPGRAPAGARPGPPVGPPALRPPSRPAVTPADGRAPPRIGVAAPNGAPGGFKGHQPELKVVGSPSRPKWFFPAIASAAVVVVGMVVALFLSGGPGTVAVSYEPRDARVFVDGAEVCATSTCFADKVKPGVHVLEIRKEGYEPFKEEIEVASGAIFKRSPDVKLRALVTKVGLVLASDPSDAEVTLDGKVVKPLGRSGIFRSELDAGTPHELSVSKPGYKTWKEKMVPSAEDAKGGIDKFAQLEKEGFVIELTSTPAGCDVLVDNVKKGQTPLKLDSLDPAKTYSVIFRKDCYEDGTATVLAGSESGKVFDKRLKKKAGPCK
jgi:hypothetical protein